MRMAVWATCFILCKDMKKKRIGGSGKRTKRSPKKTKRRGRSTRHVAKSDAVITIARGKVVMLLPKRLPSLNARGGHWEQAKERRDWEALIAGASVITDGSVTLPVDARRRLSIVRLCPTKRYLLDTTNLASCGKRLEDSLVALGYLMGDDRFGVDGPFITQGVSADCYYWAIVTISWAAGYVDNTPVVNAAEYAALAIAS